ncbi:MAG: hypothetical protein E7A35_18640, partial [Leclercia adecarboxylata]|nr:hypothetical protein [Leclercia adecarboxylata]
MTIKLIVGLANPGAEYAATRHNAGAWYVDLLAERLRAPLREEPKFFGYTSRVNLAGADVRLLVPTTFMNLSGKAVAALAFTSMFSLSTLVSPAFAQEQEKALNFGIISTESQQNLKP